MIEKIRQNKVLAIHQLSFLLTMLLSFWHACQSEVAEERWYFEQQSDNMTEYIVCYALGVTAMKYNSRTVG